MPETYRLLRSVYGPQNQLSARNSSSSSLPNEQTSKREGILDHLCGSLHKFCPGLREIFSVSLFIDGGSVNIYEGIAKDLISAGLMGHKGR
ncbi:hypothetical protein CDAR_17191 [Caerostris darwini]|uniref:Uncharacterized protein n=1 Tax=Caerostris darwini TaxID=1538125 RepID=A0AAV4N3U5_9ARAC|nr:hypothetical protein CDAR_17191 [Caerostris darwini]